jgi:hypothetical protein
MVVEKLTAGLGSIAAALADRPLALAMFMLALVAMTMIDRLADIIRAMADYRNFKHSGVAIRPGGEDDSRDIGDSH